MKTKKLFMVAAAAITVLLGGALSGRAQEFYPAFLNAVAISTNNSTGQLTYSYFRNRDVIQQCADEMGITNVEGLSLVYDGTAHTLDVVSGSGTNRTVVCTAAAFSGGTSLSNAKGTETERLAFVFWEGATVANGTLAASEHTFTSVAGRTFFNLQGQLQFSVAGSGTNGPTIYLGNLAAGNGFFDDGFPGAGDRGNSSGRDR